MLIIKLMVGITEQNKISNNENHQYQDKTKLDQSPIIYIQQIKSVKRHDFDDKFHVEPRESIKSERIRGIMSNKDLMSVLGLRPSSLLISNRRKQVSHLLSKKKYQPDNSRMFIIKLPPNYSYYANEKDEVSNNDKNNKNNETVC